MFFKNTKDKWIIFNIVILLCLFEKWAAQVVCPEYSYLGEKKPCKQSQKGETCKIVCEPGLSIYGHFVITCGDDGEWNDTPTCLSRDIEKNTLYLKEEKCKDYEETNLQNCNTMKGKTCVLNKDLKPVCECAIGFVKRQNGECDLSEDIMYSYVLTKILAVPLINVTEKPVQNRGENILSSQHAGNSPEKFQVINVWQLTKLLKKFLLQNNDLNFTNIQFLNTRFYGRIMNATFVISSKEPNFEKKLEKTLDQIKTKCDSETLCQLYENLQILSSGNVTSEEKEACRFTSCDFNAYCISKENTKGFSCKCSTEYFNIVFTEIKGKHEFQVCEDINECRINMDDCDKNTTTCENLIGSFRCNCKFGYKKKKIINTYCSRICNKIELKENVGFTDSMCVDKYDGETCKVRCFSGYSPDDRKELVCIEGSWRGQQPTCRERCRKPNLRENVQFYDEEWIRLFKDHGETCKLRCKNDYGAVHIKKIMCNNGKWSDGQPACLEEYTYGVGIEITTIIVITILSIALLVTLAIFITQIKKLKTKLKQVSRNNEGTDIGQPNVNSYGSNARGYSNNAMHQ